MAATDKNKNAAKKGQPAAPNVPQPTSSSANKPEVTSHWPLIFNIGDFCIY